MQSRREPLVVNDKDAFPLDAFSIPPQYKVRRGAAGKPATLAGALPLPHTRSHPTLGPS